MTKTVKRKAMCSFIWTMLISIMIGCTNSNEVLVDDVVTIESTENIFVEAVNDVLAKTEDLNKEETSSDLYVLNENMEEGWDDELKENTEILEEYELNIENTEAFVDGEITAVVDTDENIAEEVIVQEDKESTYTVDIMSAIMYAQQVVNVRKGPGIEYERIGVLALNQEVKVTGRANAGWYEIVYSDGVGYVSGRYLSSEKVVEQSMVDTDIVPSEDKIVYENEIMVEEVMSTDEMPILEERDSSTNQENDNSDITMFPITSEVTPADEEETYSVYLDQNMLELVNAHRLENGKDILVWNTQYEQLAMDRITKIAENGVLSHEGNPGSAEVLCMNYEWEGVDAEGFIKKYLNSPGHYEVLLYGNNRTMVAATCKVTGREYGDEYYNVIIIF